MIGMVQGSMSAEAATGLGSLPLDAVVVGSLPPDVAVGGSLPADAAVVGGSTPIALAAIITFFLAVGLSLVVTYRVIEGYRQTRDRPIMFIAMGIFFLAPAPMLFRFLLVNLTTISPTIRTVVASGSELLGLLLILYTVYDR